MGSLQQPSEQLELPLIYGNRGEASKAVKGAEGLVAEYTEESSVTTNSEIEEVLGKENLKKALKQVIRNKGCPGIDNMKVEELTGYLKIHWPAIKESLVSGRYNPSPVKRVEIQKPGGIRKLGIPTVTDRFIQQAMLQVLQEKWDKTFSDNSFGFRPKRSAHQAVQRAQGYVKSGKRWVVDIDLEKFFDRVNHDKLMGLVARRTKDERILRIIRSYLNAGVMENGVYIETEEGTPQGGPLSPLLSNVILAELDKELERREHKFVRYADDCNVYVGSRNAGERVMKSLTGYISDILKLKVNQAKSAVDRPWYRKFLGFSVTNRQEAKLKVAPESIKRFKIKAREITSRTRGISLQKMIEDLAVYVKGWMGYFRKAEVSNSFGELDKWIRRRLRSMIWKSWDRRGYKELRRKGIDSILAWNAAKSAHGPWRISHSPALEIALPVKYFERMGLPQLKNMIGQH
jgi:RNA-directed DNA polymerase